jgi:transcriptional regulator with XRE-family HTH domain
MVLDILRHYCLTFPVLDPYHQALFGLERMGRARLATNRVFYASAGKKICDARAAKRMTQEELASRVSLTRTSIINIEKGRQQILLHTLVDIARELGVAPAELLPALSDDRNSADVRTYLSAESRKVREWVQSGLKKVREGD